MTKIANPVPIWLDSDGTLLDAGSIYLGEANTDPEVEANQIDLFFDEDMTVPAPQPLRTLGGVIVNGLNNAFIFTPEADFSIVVRNADGSLVMSHPTSTGVTGAGYQPLDADLTAIAAQGTDAFGRSLLLVSDDADLRDAAGLGTAALLNEASPADFPANTPDRALTTDQVWASAVPVALVQSGGNVAVDLATALNFTLAMTGGPWTLSAPTHAKPGQSGTIEITQDATGNRVLNYDAAWKFAGGTDPVLSTPANSRDVLFYRILADGSPFASLAKGVA